MTPDLPPALNAPDAEATTLLNPTEILRLHNWEMVMAE